MYFNQPYCGNVAPFQVPTCPMASSFPTLSPCPMVIGEGDVTSVVYPDGSVQFFFLPNSQQLHNVQTLNLGTAFTSPSYGSTNNNKNVAWYIRSIPNLSPCNINPQLCSHPNALPYSDQNWYTNTNQGLQIKFHNDGWTSTTDLQYFFPSLLRRDLFPKVNTAIQGDLPEIPCICTKTRQIKTKECFDSTSNNSSKTSIKPKPKQKHKKGNVKSKDLQSNKSITTYNDQATDCRSETRKTQTSFNASGSMPTSDDDLKSAERKFKCKRNKKSSKGALCTCDSSYSFTSTEAPYNCDCDSFDSMQE